MNVEIRNLPSSKGKCLCATSNIQEGTVIFEEEPLVSCQFSWNACCKYKACDHCLRPLETAEENVRRLTGNPLLELPYPECCQTKQLEITSCPACGIQYCSEWCRTTALEQYHKVICLQTLDRSKVLPLEQLEETWKQMHYPPETSSIFLIVRLLARILQAPNSEEAIRTTLGFCHRTVNEEAELAHKFLGDKFIGQVGLLREMIVNALPDQKIGQFLTSEGFQSLIALIGTNGQGIGSSPFSAWRQNVQKLDLPPTQKEEINSFIEKIYDDFENHTGDFLNNEGVGLYLKQSCANHSCDPNAEIQFLHNNFKLSLVALRDIEPNEEICISYLGDCELSRSRHSRQKLLKENYIFECDCVKCVTDIKEPDVTSEEEMSAEDED
ncbi:histone-lysine N-trimethyltransferase SMYD5 [Euwallacea fornicatus]|uniref:histone-lysine N-trimethyltransferase SMYD5 n=1 Tax=Euwallacea fornicatus TaxID=995702 RepID=UPI00338D6C19